MRYIYPTLNEFTQEKIVLLSGPRQVGKTTISELWLKDKNGLYLNWDAPADRERILSPKFIQTLKVDALVVDEIHKYLRWKSWLKGLYDKKKNSVRIIATGSAKLNVFQKGEESLFGRYELLRFHPFSVGELIHGKVIPPPENWLEIDPQIPDPSLWKQLYIRSGFPEPFTKDNALQHKRWSVRRRELIIQEDVRDLSQIKTLSILEHLCILLPFRVGSPLSVNGLKEEIEVAFDTVKVWLLMLERLYYCFRISPFTKKISRSVKKEQKLYLWDWSQIEDESARFENMVASHLLKSVHIWNDIGYGEFSLNYMRDVDDREVDFLITEKNKPIVMIECKLNDLEPSPSLIFLSRKFPSIPAFQLVNKQNIDIMRGKIRIISADKFFAALT